MTTWFVDFGAANDGDGTSPARAGGAGAVGAYNTISAKSFAGGDTVWLRRNQTFQSNANVTWTYPGVTFIGWPQSSDEDYASRPSSAGTGQNWDGDATDTYATLQQIDNVSAHTFGIAGGLDTFFGDGRQQWKRIKIWNSGNSGVAVNYSVASANNVFFKYCSFGNTASTGGTFTVTAGAGSRATFISCTFNTAAASPSSDTVLSAQQNTLQSIFYDCTFTMLNAATAPATPNVTITPSTIGPSIFVRCTFTTANTAVATQAPTTALKVIADSATNTFPIVLIDCTFDSTANGTNTPSLYTVDIAGRTIVLNSKITHGSGLKVTSNGASVGRYFGPIHFTKISQTSAAIATGALQCASGTTGNAMFISIDNFLPASGNTADITLCEGALVLINNATFQSATKTTGTANPGLYCINNGSTGTFLHQGLRGQVVSSTAVTRTGGESWGVLKFNYTDATTPSWIPLSIGLPSMETIFAPLVTGSNTITIYGAYKSYTTAPTADDVWFEADYLDQSSGAHLATISSRANAALTADSSTWNGDSGLTVFKMSATVTAGQDCLAPIRLQFKRQDAAGFTYIDPLPAVSGPGGTPATIHARPWGIGTTGVTGATFLPLGPTEIPAITETTVQNSLEINAGENLVPWGYMQNSDNAYPFVQAHANPNNLSSNPDASEFMTPLGYVESISFTQKALALQIPPTPSSGILYSLKVELIDGAGNRNPLDTAPSIRVYLLNADGTETDKLVLTTMTQQGSTNSWATNWTPSSTGTYIAEVRGTWAGNKYVGSWPITVS